MDSNDRQRVFVVLENLWAKRLIEQQEKVDKTKHDWDLCYNALLPGPARTRYYQDLLYSQGYGARISKGDKRRRTRERQKFIEDRRLSHVRELHVYRRLQVEICEIRIAREALTY